MHLLSNKWLVATALFVTLMWGAYFLDQPLILLLNLLLLGYVFLADSFYPSGPADNAIIDELVKTCERETQQRCIIHTYRLTQQESSRGQLVYHAKATFSVPAEAGHHLIKELDKVIIYQRRGSGVWLLEYMADLDVDF
ncbi:hypothetical protein QCD60_30010 [Pokkaliibacter sp. MBI-7]|uniref:hypothetical protein n=1 Tax=Pokkaliibacter sp. MBI-7 TaxID=3040600 RepID=UPI00244912E0|nr:hypothetical protein [Pokkaliibacter sp. MBI-7]MDH2431056.1 hypothetical protein [Pokkaliibacter sp. MBI-7]MDH2436751.1 hypothetical protein [Pokkaliibacter sp. MBI-7]